MFIVLYKVGLSELYKVLYKVGREATSHEDWNYEITEREVMCIHSLTVEGVVLHV